jgi:uncharacterized protein
MSIVEGVIDADTHVVESDRTWALFDEDPDLAPYCPRLVESVDSRTGAPLNRWVIDGKLVPKPDGRGASRLGTPPSDVERSASHYGVPWEFRSMSDPLGRSRDAERFGIKTQVVYPTVFLADLTDQVDLNVALCRSYNSFMTAACESGDRQFSWIVVPPLLSIEATVEEIRGARSRGAVGVMFRGMEGRRSLGDPYFEPVYDAAARENIAICVHTGPGCGPLLEMADSRYMRSFGQNRVLPLIAFHDIVSNRIPERFPGLRFEFIEASASWVPFLLHFLRRAARVKGGGGESGPDLFRKNRLYVACEADEDILYLSEFIGRDHLLLGSDYGHSDQSAELDIVAKIEGREDLDVDLARRILLDNPRVLYGLGV